MNRHRRTRSSRSLKIVVTGPFGAGKTSLIESISEIAVLSTERRISDHSRSLKSATTVAMDFGRLTVDHDLSLYLFGTPGQKRFDFMWEILAEGMLGFIVLVDHGRGESLAEAADILAFFREQARVPYIIAVNKVDETTQEEAVARTRRWLEVPNGVRVVGCDARDKESVKQVLVELLYAVVDDLDASTAQTPVAV